MVSIRLSIPNSGRNPPVKKRVTVLETCFGRSDQLWRKPSLEISVVTDDDVQSSARPTEIEMAEHAAPETRNAQSAASQPPAELLALADLMESWAAALPRWDSDVTGPWFVFLERAYEAETSLAERLRRLPTCRLSMCPLRLKVSLKFAGISGSSDQGLAACLRAWARNARTGGIRALSKDGVRGSPPRNLKIAPSVGEIRISVAALRDELRGLQQELDKILGQARPHRADLLWLLEKCHTSAEQADLLLLTIAGNPAAQYLRRRTEDLFDDLRSIEEALEAALARQQET